MVSSLSWGLYPMIKAICFCLIPLFESSLASTNQSVGLLAPGFQASQNNGIFLKSNNSAFGFGFYTDADSSPDFLGVLHLASSKCIWTANRHIRVSSSDKFVFGTDGNAYLGGNSSTFIWSTNTTGDRVNAMELKDIGNLVLRGENGTILWQSFDYPIDTLIAGQKISQGVRVESNPKKNLISYLEIKSGDALLYAGYDNGPQVYWSMSKETRKTVHKVGGNVSAATIVANSWNFYDQTGSLVWQFNITKQYDPSALWIAVLGSEGTIQFLNLEGKSNYGKAVMIPQSSCSTPLTCDPFQVCSNQSGQCQCPSALSAYPFCKPPVMAVCNVSNVSTHLQLIGGGIGYPVVDYVPPQRNATTLDGCKTACMQNCSCSALFFENSSNNCFLFDQIGSLQQPGMNATSYTLLIKFSSIVVASDGASGVASATTIVVTIVCVTLVVILALCGAGFWYYRKKKRLTEAVLNTEEEESSFRGIAGMPVRYRFNDLKAVTKDFSVKLGQGGFGSVYLGVEVDGTKLAVKKLEGIGQGKKEFSAEVNIIGSVHHVHLVKLKGFCAEGAHRLLVYEHMANGSLERWIFNTGEDHPMLDLEKRLNIALGTAKGLAYLHEECEAKIIHCDIKPENVLLDDHFSAKVSDFGLAKLMHPEQSHVMTTLRGTRGYLAPEWITSFLISEKSDVYSYGMLLLEIIGGRKNYEPGMTSEKSYFPSYAFKMMEEGRLNDILDTRIDCSECDHEKIWDTIKVALWCMQEDINLRPPMSKVVQMLQGLCPVPDPPASHHTASRIYSGLIGSGSEDSNSSIRVIDNSSRHTILSATRLSGPR